MMNSPTALVAAALTAAILLTASLLIAARARGETVAVMRGQSARANNFTPASWVSNSANCRRRSRANRYHSI
jgi:hypothetical protein